MKYPVILLLTVCLPCGCHFAEYGKISRVRPGKVSAQQLKELRAQQQYAIAYYNDASETLNELIQSDTARDLLAENLKEQEELRSQYAQKRRELEQLEKERSALSARFDTEFLPARVSEYALGQIATTLRAAQLSDDPSTQTEAALGQISTAIDQIPTDQPALNPIFEAYKSSLGNVRSHLQSDKPDIPEAINDIENLRDGFEGRFDRFLNSQRREVSKMEARIGELKSDPLFKLLERATSNTTTVPITPAVQPAVQTEQLLKMNDQLNNARLALAMLVATGGSNSEVINQQARYIERLERTYTRVRVEHRREVTALQSTGAYSGLPVQNATGTKPLLSYLGVEDNYNNTIADGGAVVTSRGKTVGLLGLPVSIVKELVNVVREIFSGESTPEITGAIGAGYALSQP